MTAKTIEELLLDHNRVIGILDTSLMNFREKFEESKKANDSRFKELAGSLADTMAEATSLNLRLTVAEKEIADLRSNLERNRNNRWAVTLSLMGVMASSMLSAVIAYFIKSK